MMRLMQCAPHDNIGTEFQINLEFDILWTFQFGFQLHLFSTTPSYYRLTDPPYLQ